MRFARISAWVVLLAALSWSCVTVPKSVELGVQPGHKGFVPARIAVLTCRVWPQSAAYETMTLTQTKDMTESGVCEKFDKFILEGFADQPYMNGFAPRAVAQLLENSGKAKMFMDPLETWTHSDTDCLQCPDGPTFYRETLANRPAWRTWLQSFSAEVRHVDAILLPLVEYAYNQQTDDRGLRSWKSVVALSIYLIDTNNGELIWVRTRTGSAVNLEDKAKPEVTLTQPKWDDVLARTLVEELWKDFPGRRAR
jgi:hypothetical protein